MRKQRRSLAGLALVVVGLFGCSDSKPAVTTDTRVVDRQTAAEQRSGDLPKSEISIKSDLPKNDFPKSDLPTKGDLPKSEFSIKKDLAKDLVTPKDLSSHLSLSVLEQWYQGSITCSAPQLTATAAYGTIQVKLLQIPAAQVQGTCSGHKAEVSISPGQIAIEITGSTGSACWTACWDFSFTIAPVAPGTYQIKYLNLSTTVQVYSYNG